MSTRINRRKFLSMSLTFGAAAALAACAPATPTATEAPTGTPVPPTATLKPGEPTFTPVPPTPTPSPVTLAFDKNPKGWTSTLSAYPWKMPETIEYTTPIQDNPNITYPEGDDPVNTPQNRLMRDVAGLSAKEAFKYTSDYDTKMLAAMFDQQLPDVFNLNPQLYGRFLQAGALEDITDIWETAASPLLKEYAAKYDGRLMKSALVNGRMVGLPGGCKFTGQDNMLLYYRKDIFDKLGLTPPETIDQFEEVLRATKKEFGNDPAWVNFPGNRTVITWINSWDVFFGPTGAIPNVNRIDIRIWVKGQDGKLNYGSVDERLKPVIERIGAWYKEGLIDQEFFTRDEGKSTEAIAAGKAPMFTGPAWAIGWPGGLTKQNVPEAEWAFTLPPKGANGQRGWLETNPTYGYLLGFKKGVDPRIVEAGIRYMGYCLENYVNWPQTRFYGWQDYDWGYDGEKSAYTLMNNRINAMMGTTWGNSFTWGYFLDGVYSIFDYGAKLAKGEAEPQNGWEEALKVFSSDPALNEKDTQPVVREGVGQGVYTEFFGPPTSTMAAKGALLDKLEAETYTALLRGEKTIADFDQFVVDWKANGGDQITQEVNFWNETGKSV